MDGIAPLFSSPLSGTFFNCCKWCGKAFGTQSFSSPLSGTFFQSVSLAVLKATGVIGFRPLSRGLFFNPYHDVKIHKGDRMFSSPLSGTFFQ